MFSGVMTNAWAVGTLIAVVAGVVGFFVVLRGSTFVAHAVPLSSFAGATGAVLLGADPVAGLALFAPLSALSIGWLGRRRRADVVTALVVATMLGLGSLFAGWTVAYESEVYGLLFGNVLGVSEGQLWLSVALGASALGAVALMYRPLLLTSVSSDAAAARGVRGGVVELLFLCLVALVATTAVPVVGALLMFTLLVGPPAAARTVARAPGPAIALAVGLALVTVWASLAATYLTNWPIGFFVGVIGASWYVAARVFSALRR